MITELNEKKAPLELFEILSNIEMAEKKDKRVESIRHYQLNTGFTDYLRCLLDDRITFNLPEGPPPFTPLSEESFPKSWMKQHSNIGYFINGGTGANISSIRREKMWIDLLETVHPFDAPLIADAADKRGPEWLTKELIEEAIPDLIS